MYPMNLDPRGWWHFTVNVANTAPNITFPTRAVGVPEGQGGSTVATTVPGDALAPASRRVMLRGIYTTLAQQGAFIILDGDGLTSYFGGAIWSTGTASNLFSSWAGPLAIPLYKGLSVVGSSGSGVFIFCFEPLEHA